MTLMSDYSGDEALGHHHSYSLIKYPACFCLVFFLIRQQFMRVYAVKDGHYSAKANETLT